MSDEMIKPNDSDDTQEISTDQLGSAVGGVGGSSMSESSELDYLKLQTTQSNDTQQAEAVSNILKRISDTDEQVTQNMK
jgi:hypothetical protein